MKDSSIPLLLRIAESSSSLGAAILGLGIGIWFSSDLKQFQWPLVILGGVLHLFGMVMMNMHDKKLEQLSLFWRILFRFLFWICLLFLVYIFVKVIWIRNT
jgi:hypothetical protein